MRETLQALNIGADPTDDTDAKNNQVSRTDHSSGMLRKGAGEDQHTAEFGGQGQRQKFDENGNEVLVTIYDQQQNQEQLDNRTRPSLKQQQSNKPLGSNESHHKLTTINDVHSTQRLHSKNSDEMNNEYSFLRNNTGNFLKEGSGVQPTTEQSADTLIETELKEPRTAQNKSPMTNNRLTNAKFTNAMTTKPATTQ